VNKKLTIRPYRLLCDKKLFASIVYTRRRRVITNLHKFNVQSCSTPPASSLSPRIPYFVRSGRPRAKDIPRTSHHLLTIILGGFLFSSRTTAIAYLMTLYGRRNWWAGTVCGCEARVACPDDASIMYIYIYIYIVLCNIRSSLKTNDPKKKPERTKYTHPHTRTYINERNKRITK